MAVVNPPGFLQNVSTHTAQVDRIASMGAGLMPNGAGLTFRGGCRGVGDLKVAAQATPNMTVQVSAGLALVAGTQNAFQGLYSVPNDGVVNVTITAANASLPRNDLIIARIQDSFYSGATNTATIEVVTGVAASTPADPTVPANSLLLARVRVAAAATSIDNGHIDDLRTFTAAMGGVTFVRTASALPAAANSQVGDRAIAIDTGIDYYFDGAAWYGGWITPTLGNGWTALGGFQAPRFCRVGRIVYIEGHIVPGTNAVAAFTLPVGYRPAASLIMQGNSNSTSLTAGRFDVTAAGGIVPQGSPATWLSINCSFPADA